MWRLPIPPIMRSRCEKTQLLHRARVIFTNIETIIFPVDANLCVDKHMVVRPIMACLPAWFRFAQCLRRYRDTKEAFPHLANAAKYSTSFFVVIFTSLTTVYSGKWVCWLYARKCGCSEGPWPLQGLDYVYFIGARPRPCRTLLQHAIFVPIDYMYDVEPELWKPLLWKLVC